MRCRTGCPPPGQPAGCYSVRLARRRDRQDNGRRPRGGYSGPARSAPPPRPPFRICLPRRTPTAGHRGGTRRRNHPRRLGAKQGDNGRPVRARARPAGRAAAAFAAEWPRTPRSPPCPARPEPVPVKSLIPRSVQDLIAAHSGHPFGLILGGSGQLGTRSDTSRRLSLPHPMPPVDPDLCGEPGSGAVRPSVRLRPAGGLARGQPRATSPHGQRRRGRDTQRSPGNHAEPPLHCRAAAREAAERSACAGDQGSCHAHRRPSSQIRPRRARAPGVVACSWLVIASLAVSLAKIASCTGPDS